MSTDPRDVRVKVTCELQVAESCSKTYTISMRAEAKNRARNKGTYMCLVCSRRSKFSGRSNPNTKHHGLDDHFLSDINTEGKAYLLGWLASDGHVSQFVTSTVLRIHSKDRGVLDQLIEIVGCPLPIFERSHKQVGFSVNSRQVQQDVCRHLKISKGKKAFTVGFPDLPTDELRLSFIRGFFDGDGTIRKPSATRQTPECAITTNSSLMRQGILKHCGVKGHENNKRATVSWSGSAALDFLSRLYDNSSYYLPRKKDAYMDWCSWVTCPAAPHHKIEGVHFKWSKTRPDAVAPSKTRASDSGFDLTVLSAGKTIGDVTWYETGIRLHPGYGWYFDLVPRSSICKTGYMLANSVGIIDRTFIGPVSVPLRKVDPSAPNLQLPAKIAQVIPRHAAHVIFLEVNNFHETDRGEGAFGSTGAIS